MTNKRSILNTEINIIGTVNASQALNKPLDYQLILKQFSRLGNTIFSLNDLTVDIDPEIMLPISELNDVRRRAVQSLEEQRLSKFDRSTKQSVEFKNNYDLQENFYSISTVQEESSTRLIVAVDNIDSLKIAVNAGAKAILFGGESYHHKFIKPQTYKDAIAIAHSNNIKLFIATPRIVREFEQSSLEEIITAVGEADGIYVHNLATLHLVKRLSKLPIHSDYSLIAFNDTTIDFFSSLGIDSVTLSPELTLEQIKFIAKVSPLPLECIVHGRLELMISQYCIPGSFIGGVGEKKCSQPCCKHKFFLKDRKSALFPIVTDQFCRMHILNSKPLSMLPYASNLKDIGISQLRIDGRYLSDSELSSTVKNYTRTLQGDTLSEPADFDFTRGHYFRGVTSAAPQTS